jgi:hypothetical protein
VRRLRVVTWPLRFAIGAMLLGIVLLSDAGWRATHFASILPASLPPNGRPIPGSKSYRQGLISELDDAVELDPFHPERRRPQIRYELPGSVVEKPAEPVPVADPVELLGTVIVAGGRSFAMCQSSAGTQVVHVGEKVGGYTLKSVEPGSAVFVSPEGKVMNVSVKKTGS